MKPNQMMEKELQTFKKYYSIISLLFSSFDSYKCLKLEQPFV